MVRERRWKRTAGIVVAVLAGIIGLALIVGEVLAERWVDSHRAGWAKELSTRLERPVRIGDTSVSVVLGRVRADDVSIGANASERKSGAPPVALQLQRASVNVGVWRTLLSFGRRPYVQEVAVDGLRANVVRRPDGTLNVQEMADRLGGEKQPEKAEEPPDERGRNARIGELTIPRAQVALITLGRRAQEVRISDLDLRGRDLGYHAGGDVSLQAAVAAPQRNLELHARVDGVPRGDRGAPPRVHELKLRLQPVEIAPLARFAAGNSRAPLERGVLSADLNVEGRGGGDGDAAAQGYIRLAGAQYPGGKRFDAALDLDLALANDGDQLTVNKSTLRAGDMQLFAQGKLDQLREAPRVQQLAIRSQGLDFDGLRALYPELDRRTAPARLRGPFAITASGKGTRDASAATLEVDMTRTAIDVDDRFDKPSGTPLRLEAQLATRGRAVDVAPFTLQIADYRVLGRGRVADVNKRDSAFSLALETPSPAVSGLLALLPRVSRGLPKGASAGSLDVQAKIEGTRERFTGSGKLELAQLRANAQGAKFDGGGSARFEVKRDRQHFSGNASADFTQLVAVYPGLIDKPERTPLRFDVNWDAKGVGQKPAALAVSLPKFEAKAGRSDLSGSMSLRNADNPQVKIDVRSNYLDTADFQLTSPEPEGKAKPRRKEEGALAKADGTLSLRVREGVAAGSRFENLNAKLRVQDGRARAETLQATAFGGQFDGAGSEFPLFAERAPYRIKGKVSQMGVDPLLQTFTGQGGLMSGTLGAAIDVSADGMTLEDLQRSLTGKLDGKVADATFLAVDGEAALVKNLQQVAQIPGLKEQLGSAGERAAKGEGWQLRDLAGKLRFEKGAVFIPKDGLTAHTPQGDLRLEGRVGMSASDLRGTLMLEPKALDAMLGTKTGLTEPVPVSLQLKGSIERPQLAFGNLAPALRPALESYARSQLGAEGGKAVDEALRRAGLAPKSDQEQAKGKKDKGKGKEERGAKQQQQLEQELRKKLPKLF